MSNEPTPKQSQLITVLREGVSVVQMIFFKEVRSFLSEKHPNQDTTFISMLAGAIINDVFSTPNPEKRFASFYKENKGLIEQELLGLKESGLEVLPALTDALRIQALCDNQEGGDSSHVLKHADQLGILMMNRPVPMPSSFMTLVRGLGEKHNLLIAPVQIDPEDDEQLVH